MFCRMTGMYKLVANRANEEAAGHSVANSSPVVYYLTYIGTGESYGKLADGVGRYGAHINFSGKPDGQPGLVAPAERSAPFTVLLLLSACNEGPGKEEVRHSFSTMPLCPRCITQTKKGLLSWARKVIQVGRHFGVCSSSALVCDLPALWQCQLNLASPFSI